MGPTRKLLKTLTILIIVVSFSAALAGLVFAHGGHGKPEIQFKIVPKTIESLDKVVIKMGKIKITRGEFFNYIRNVGAFQMKADLVQRDFLLHYWITEGLSRYYPQDINPFMQQLVNADPNSEDYKKKMDGWIESQAGLFARFMYFYQRAVDSGKVDFRVNAVMESFEKHAKRDFLEELISFSDIKPSLHDLNKYVEGLPAEKRKAMDTLYPDPDKFKDASRKKARVKWIEFRRDLMENTPYKKDYLKIETMKVDRDTPFITVDGKVTPIINFFHTYGPIPNDTNFNNIKKSRGSQMLLAYAMSHHVDRLDIAPRKVTDKIELARKLYLASEQIVNEFGPTLFNQTDPTITFQFFRQVASFSNLIKFEKLFIEKSEQRPVYKTLWMDKEYLRSLEWTVEEAYTPKQPKFF